MSKNHFAKMVYNEVLQAINAEVTKGDKERFLLCTDSVIRTFVGEQTIMAKGAGRQYMADTYLEPLKFQAGNLIAEGDFSDCLRPKSPELTYLRFVRST